MSILTNFLKLLKPEPNDFVDVVKHISENYDKLDENAKTNNDTLTNLKNNKLDKGTLPSILTSAEIIYKMLTGNTGRIFDPNILYIQDVGNKVAGRVYLDREGGRMYEAIRNTTSTDPSSPDFLDLSNASLGNRIYSLENGKLDRGTLPGQFKDAAKLYEILSGNAGKPFDPAVLYIQDTGTKYVDRYYLDKNNGRMYSCFVQTDSTVNSSDFFEDQSNRAISAKLEGVTRIETYRKVYAGVTYEFKRIGNTIIFNSNGKITTPQSGEGYIFQIDDSRFIPRYYTFVFSVSTAEIVLNGSIDTGGKLIMQFGPTPIQPQIRINGTGIANEW